VEGTLGTVGVAQGPAERAPVAHDLNDENNPTNEVPLARRHEFIGMCLLVNEKICVLLITGACCEACDFRSLLWLQ
jgi:hypothetical protein